MSRSPHSPSYLFILITACMFRLRMAADVSNLFYFVFIFSYDDPNLLLPRPRMKATVGHPMSAIICLFCFHDERGVETKIALFLLSYGVFLAGEWWRKPMEKKV